MIKKLLSLLPILAVLVAVVFILHPAKALAFNANNLMDDGVFNNANTMSAATIDNWLNANFPSSCISSSRGFMAPLPTGYSPTGPIASGGFSYGADATAGAIIYAAAQAYGLNPQVILATLQKEQSLVTGDAGCSVLRYVGAMGNGCPDGGASYNYSGFELYSINGVVVTSVNGTCVGPNSSGYPSSVGFSRQVITATWKLKFWEQRSEGNVNWNVQIPPNWDNSDDPPSCHAYLMTQGYRARSTSTATCAGVPGNQVNYYDGYTTIDATSVYLTNGATAALYIYTPHFPGNQNFDTIFQNWFGSPINPCGSDPSDQPATSGRHSIGDYNGDGKTDAAVFRPSDGCWHIRAVGDFQYGQAGDIPVPGDYNGDGKTDAAVFRPSDGYWHIRGVGDFLFGQPGDIPVPGDYNGDGKTDIAIYRPSDGYWHIRGVGDFQHGQPGDIPVPADYNGDGRADGAVYRPLDGGWRIRAFGDFPYGWSTDIPAPADYNGDGRAEIAVYRPDDGGWRIRAVGDFPFGWSTDIPVPGDYNGDGKTDIAIYRPSDGGWRVRAVGDFPHGNSTDIPAVQTLNAYLLKQYGLISSY